MHAAIGGELVRPNATRFGTNYMFLESFWKKQEKFRVWMTSPEWINSNWNSDPDHDYTYDCLINRKWWESVKWALDIISLMYTILRYADSQKLGFLSGFMSRMMHARHHLSSAFPVDSLDKSKYLKVVDKRVEHLYKNTLMVAVGVLEPAGHYTYNFGKDLPRVKALTAALKKMTSHEEFIKLIHEIDMYINFRGAFGGTYPEHASSRVSSTQWWMTFGDSTPLLQKYALRIVSQCISSSGRECNWSLFALVHTVVRNRLGFERLHKLVFCHHNLRLRIREMLDETKEKEVDPCAILMDVSLYDTENPIMDWLANPMSESAPSNEECNGDPYADPNPTVLEVAQRKRRKRRGNYEEEEEEEEDEEAGGEDEDGEEADGEEEGEEANGAEEEQEHDDANQTLRRKSTRKKKKSMKLLSALKAQEEAKKMRES